MSDVEEEKGAGSLLSDRLTPWLVKGAKLGTILTLWAAALFPAYPERVKPFAFAVAAIITLAGAGFYYWKMRRERRREIPQQGPIRTTVLRSFLPFEDGDELIGRRGDIGDVVTILQNREFRFGVVLGESGCGKTSFFRAGVVPALRDRNYAPIYIARPTADPAAEIRRYLPDSLGVKTVVLIDQFEEFFLLNTSRKEAEKLGAAIAALLIERPQCAVMVGIRQDFFARLQNLAPGIPDPTSRYTTFELQNLHTEAARQVLQSASINEKWGFEKSLIDAILEDLESDHHVRPVDLQLIGTRLRWNGISTKLAYEQMGRRAGIIGSFIRDALQGLPKPMVGELVLRKLCAPDGETKSPVDIALKEITADIRARDPALLSDNKTLPICMKQLQDARIVIQTEREKFNLTHDSLALLIRESTRGVLSKSEAARRLLSRYLNDFRQDPTVRIRIRDLRLILRDGNRDTIRDQLTKALLRQSYESAAMAAVAPVAIAFFVITVAAYAVISLSWSISTEPAAFAMGPPSIVIRSGIPSLRFLPGSEAITDDLGIGTDSLDLTNPQALAEVPRGTIWHFGGSQRAITTVGAMLSPLARISLLRNGGEFAPAIAAFGQQQAKPDFLNRASNLAAAARFGLLARAQPDAITDAMLKRMFNPAKLKSTSIALLPENGALLRMALDKPSLRKLVTLGLPDALDILRDQSKASTPSEKRNWAWGFPEAEFVITALGMNGETAAEPADFAALVAILRDENTELYARSSILQLLPPFAAGNSRLAGPALALALDMSLNYKPNDESGWINRRAAMMVAELVVSYPEAVSSPEVALILQSESIAAPSDAFLSQYAIMLSLVGKAYTSALPASFISALQERVHNIAAKPRLAAICAIALAHMSVSDTRLRHSEVVDLVHAELQRPGQTSSFDGLQRAAASAMADLALTGQIDQTRAFKAISALAGIGLYASSAGGGGWQVNRADSDLARIAFRFDGAIDGRTVATLLHVVETSGVNGADEEALYMLIAAAPFAPAALLDQHKRLYAISIAAAVPFEYRVRRSIHVQVIAALARADLAAQQNRTLTALVSHCMDLVARQRNAEEWQAGVYCAYFLGLDDPKAMPLLKERLEPLLSANGARRIAASMALEALATARRVHEAVRDRARMPWVRELLRIEASDDEMHIRIAAKTGLTALEARAP